MTALLTCFVPIEYYGTTFEQTATVNGNTVPMRYEPRTHNGHAVVDVPVGLFNQQLAGPQGKLWADANPEVIAWLGEADRRTMTCNAFPGANRAPPPVALPVTVPVILVRMLAPNGCGGACVEGVALPIGDDRTVTVSDAVADILLGHGFVITGGATHVP